MADKTYTIRLDTSEVDANAERAARATDALESGLDRLAAASGRAQAALGRMASAGGAGGSAGFNSSEIYAFADAYEVLPSKGDAFRESQQRASLASANAAAKLTEQADAARRANVDLGITKSLAEGQSASTLRASDATQQYASSLRTAGAGSGSFASAIFLVSAFVDDAQYGFRAIVNQVPQAGMAIASMFGASTEGALKFAGMLGIAAVATNLLINHWEQVKDAIQGTPLEQPVQLITDAFQALGEKIGFASTQSEKFQAKLDEAAKKGAEAIGKIQSPETRAQADALKEAIAVTKDQVDPVDAIIEARKARGEEFTAEGEKEQRKIVQGDIGKALGGDQKALDTIIGQAGGGGLFGAALASRVAGNAPDMKADAKAEEDRVKQESAEAAAHNEAIDKANADRAKALAAGPLGTQAFAGQVIDTESVQRQLAESGEDVSLETAADVATQLGQAVEEETSKRAQAEGISPEDASAAIAEERYADIRKEAEDEEKKRADALKEQTDEAKKGGADKLAEAAAGTGMDQGRIAQYLQTAGGLPPEVAAQLAGEAAGGAQQDAMQQFLKGEKPRNVEVFGSTSAYLEKAQTAVGGTGDTQQRSLQEQVLMNQKLQILIERNQKFGFGNNDEQVF